MEKELLTICTIISMENVSETNQFYPLTQHCFGEHNNLMYKKCNNKGFLLATFVVDTVQLSLKVELSAYNKVEDNKVEDNNETKYIQTYLDELIATSNELYNQIITPVELDRDTVNMFTYRTFNLPALLDKLYEQFPNYHLGKNIGRKIEDIADTIFEEMFCQIYFKKEDAIEKFDRHSEGWLY